MRFWKRQPDEQAMVRPKPDAPGISGPDAVDLVAISPSGNVAQIVIVLSEEWADSDGGLAVLQDKVNNTVSFAVDGQMLSMYPELEGMPWEIVIDPRIDPGPRTTLYVEQVGPRVVNFGGSLRMRGPGEPWS
jgi:hypothetical protein